MRLLKIPRCRRVEAGSPLPPPSPPSLPAPPPPRCTVTKVSSRSASHAQRPVLMDTSLPFFTLRSPTPALPRGQGAGSVEG
ncbi:hypothetical protein E2C01_049365 [Portunus trituberculatus]|uniref:Uncharacterized protein n=1 Tax=Portunus trituberculatus TaxID=210409 RepID=A0A5B7G5D3_PORTR|nr:hypothetical protein [Portunus trituberculatus]